MSKINEYLELNDGNPFASNIKMLCHIDRLSEYFVHKDTWPVFMEVNLTDKCNLACKWCICENRNSNEINTDLLLDFIEDFSNCNGKALTWSGGGEPTQHPNFKVFTRCAVNKNIELGLMTNGLFKKDLIPFIKENFEWLRISLDVVDREKYKCWKGVDAVAHVLNNIYDLSKAEGKAKIGINVNISDEYTEFDALAVITTCYDYVDYIQFRPVLPRYFKDEKIAINNKVWNYLIQYYGDDPKINLSLDKLEDLENNNILNFTSCEGHFFSPILDADGKIRICMYHPNNENMVLMDLNEEVYYAWKDSDTRSKAIEYIREFDYKKNCQACCKLTEINKFVDNLKHKTVKDVNFL